MKEKTMDNKFRKRLQQRFHYGDMANIDVPSLPLTELAVNYFHDDETEKFGHVDLYSASNVIRCNNVSPCSVVLSMLYAKRLRQQKQRNKELLQTMSSADVFFISMMMASKYLYDEGVEEEVFNDVWADNTDQDVDDVNQMEMDFLKAMDWKLFVRPQEFEETINLIERRLALQEGLKRGWYTYTEMDILMNSDLMWSLWTNVGSECSKLLSAISAAYLTTILSMMGSTALAVQISGHLSCITMNLLTLQSSSLALAVSSGLSPSLPALSLFLMPSSLTPDDSVETNESDLNTPGFVTSEKSKSATLTLDGQWYERLNGELDHIPGSEEVEENEMDSRQTADNGYDKIDNVQTQSSLWSLLFFDSLVSQLWAVICIKAKLTHYVDWSASDILKMPDRFDHDDSSDVLSDRLIPQFQKHQPEQKKRYEEKPTRIVTSRSRTPAHKTNKPTKTSVAGHEVYQPADIVTYDHISLGHCSDFLTHFNPWQHTSQALDEHCSNAHLNCHKHKSQSLLSIPKEISSIDLVIVNCQDCVTHLNKYSWTQTSKDCLIHHSQDCSTHQSKECLTLHSYVNINPNLRDTSTKENNTQPLGI